MSSTNATANPYKFPDDSGVVTALEDYYSFPPPVEFAGATKAQLAELDETLSKIEVIIRKAHEWDYGYQTNFSHFKKIASHATEVEGEFRSAMGSDSGRETLGQLRAVVIEMKNAAGSTHSADASKASRAEVRAKELLRAFDEAVVDANHDIDKLEDVWNVLQPPSNADFERLAPTQESGTRRGTPSVVFEPPSTTFEANKAAAEEILRLVRERVQSPTLESPAESLIADATFMRSVYKDFGNTLSAALAATTSSGSTQTVAAPAPKKAGRPSKNSPTAAIPSAAPLPTSPPPTPESATELFDRAVAIIAATSDRLEQVVAARRQLVDLFGKQVASSVSWIEGMKSVNEMEKHPSQRLRWAREFTERGSEIFGRHEVLTRRRVVAYKALTAEVYTRFVHSPDADWKATMFSDRHALLDAAPPTKTAVTDMLISLHAVGLLFGPEVAKAALNGTCVPARLAETQLVTEFNHLQQIANEAQLGQTNLVTLPTPAPTNKVEPLGL